MTNREIFLLLTLAVVLSLFLIARYRANHNEKTLKEFIKEVKIYHDDVEKFIGHMKKDRDYWRNWSYHYQKIVSEILLSDSLPKVWDILANSLKEENRPRMSVK